MPDPPAIQIMGWSADSARGSGRVVLPKLGSVERKGDPVRQNYYNCEVRPVRQGDLLEGGHSNGMILGVLDFEMSIRKRGDLGHTLCQIAQDGSIL